MNNKIGIFKLLLINFYDLILLFAVLYFFTIPVIMISGGNAVINNTIYQIYLILVIFMYYAWFWKQYGQTLGMKIWKVKIFSNDSKSINYKQTILRIIFGILGGHVLLLVHDRSLQDIISKTYLSKID